MVKFWVGFALLIAAFATVSYWSPSGLGSPGDFHLSVGGGSGERGSGVAKTESRQVGEFSSIHAEGAGTLDVEVGPGKTGRTVEVSTDDNLIDLITTEVRDGVLEVSAVGSISPRSDLRLKVAVPALAGIHLEGANRLNLRIDTPGNFDLHIEGAGRVRAAGKVGTLTLHSEGAGDVEANELVAGTVDVQIEGAGKARVNATDNLNAKIEGAGLITYSGDPKNVQKAIDGFGRIRKAE